MKKLIIIAFLMRNILFASVINIPDDYSTIQAGVDAASDGDTVIVNSGTYYENIEFGSFNIVLMSATGRDSTVIDGLNNGRVITINNNAIDTTTVINGFTIQNGFSGSWSNGGGVYLAPGANASVKISNCLIQNNTCQGSGSNGFGGGFYSNNSSSVIENTIFTNNSGSEGGAVCLAYDIATQIRGCEFYSNTVTNSGSSIEILYNSTGKQKILNSSFHNEDNPVEIEQASDDTVIFKDCNFYDNTGIGIDNRSSRRVYIESCTFSNITSAENQGGAIRSSGPILSISNSIFQNVSNTSSGRGAVLYADGDSIYFEQNLIVDNPHPGSTTGQSLIFLDNIDHVDVRSSIFWCEEIGLFERYFGSTSSGNISQKLDIWYSNINAELPMGVGLLGNIYTNPFFCDVSNGDYSVAANSPVIGSGQNGVNIGGVSSGCDSTNIGPIWYVSPDGSDDNDGFESTPFATIETAKNYFTHGDTIQLLNGTFMDDANCDLEFSNIELVLLGSDSSTIDCGGDQRFITLRDYDDKSFLIDGITITNCYANEGSAIAIFNSTNSNSVISNCVITGNESWSNNGGIIHIDGSSPSIINNTIVNNISSGTNGSAITSWSSSDGPIIKNNILWSNDISGGEIYFNTTSSHPLVEYNNIENSDTWHSSIWNSNGNIDAAPRFVDSDNGDYHLSDYSPCIGASTLDGAPDTDIEGNPRPNPEGSSPDIGAYENPLAEPAHNSFIYVSTDGTDEGSVGFESDPFASIQAAIDYSIDGDTILVYPGIYAGDINYNSKNLVIGSFYLTTQDTSYISSTIISDWIFIDGLVDNSASLSGFTITDAGVNQSGSNNSAIYCYGDIYLNNLIIRDNNTARGIRFTNSNATVEDCEILRNNIQDSGAGIYIENESNVMFTNVTISVNTASNLGGGIYIDGSTVQLNNSRIANNSSMAGGGLYFTGEDLSIQSSKIDSNNTTSAGGGIYIWSGDTEIENSIISNNESQGGGGGIAHYSGNGLLTIVNTTIANNTVQNASLNGGGFYSTANTVNVINSILWNNSPQQISATGELNLNINHSNIDGGSDGIYYYAGGAQVTLTYTDNVDSDPLFVDPDNGDYHLQSTSPCIDAGDPDLDGDGITWLYDIDDQDPDGTRLDMGAFYFDQFDPTPPTVSITSLSATNVGTEDDLTVNWEAEDNLLLDSAFVDLFYSDTTYRVDTTNAESGSIAIDIPDSTLESFQIILTVWDSRQNEAKDTSAVISVFDNTPPEISISHPVSGFSVLENELFSVKWNHSDNISILDHLFEYTTDGVMMDTLLHTTNLTTEDSMEFSIPNFTNTAMIKVTIQDHNSNNAFDVTPIFEILDATPPEVEILSPSPETNLLIDEIEQVIWITFENDTVTHIDLYYSVDSANWSLISENEENDGDFYWNVPNTPSENVAIMLIGFNRTGLTDTSIVENLSITPNYPTITSVTHDGETLLWNEQEILITFSTQMDQNLFSNEFITVSNNQIGILSPTLETQTDAKQLLIRIDDKLTTLDTLTVSISEELTSNSGYGLDGNGDGLPGDSYSITFPIGMLADYDTSYSIDAVDLAVFVQALDENDLTKELGPVFGILPHYYTSSDSKLDIEDLMAFVMMWNWYVTTNSSALAELEGEGIQVEIHVSPDSIYFDLPVGILAYEVKIKHDPQSVSMGQANAKGLLSSNDINRELGIYSFIGAPGNEMTFALPISLQGKEANVSINFRALGRGNQIISQQSSSLTILNIPDEYSLHQNYPNPFNPITTIEYDVPRESYISLVIYDILGRHVTTLTSNVEEPGYKSIIWDGTDDEGMKVGSGMYFYHLKADNFSSIRKMALLK